MLGVENIKHDGFCDRYTGPFSESLAVVEWSRGSPATNFNLAPAIQTLGTRFVKEVLRGSLLTHKALHGASVNCMRSLRRATASGSSANYLPIAGRRFSIAGAFEFMVSAIESLLSIHLNALCSGKVMTTRLPHEPLALPLTALSLVRVVTTYPHLSLGSKVP